MHHHIREIYYFLCRKHATVSSLEHMISVLKGLEMHMEVEDKILIDHLREWKTESK